MTTKTVAVRMNTGLYQALVESAEKHHLKPSTLLRMFAAEKLEKQIQVSADEHLRSSRTNEQELSTRIQEVENETADLVNFTNLKSLKNYVQTNSRKESNERD